MKPIELGAEDIREFVGAVGIVERAAGGTGEFAEQILVVAVPEPERAGANAVALQAGGDDLLHLRGLRDADVEKTIGEEQLAANGAGRRAAQLIAAQHPATRQIGAASALDTINAVEDGLLARHRTHGDHDLGGIVEGDEGKLILAAEVLHDGLGGAQGRGQGIPAHGTAAVEDDRKGDGVVAVPGMAGGGELKREVNGLGAVGEDGLIIELDGRFHRPPA